MTDPTPDAPADAAVTAAHAYESLHVPALFRSWAEPVLDAGRVAAGSAVLDVACGTGVLARTALDRVGAEGGVAGLDADAGMLAVAAETEPRVAWHWGTADALPFDDESFDAVVSQFGLMFFPDRPKAVAEMLRVLRPGGTLAVAVWNEIDANETYRALGDLFGEMAGEPAADALRVPFGFGGRSAIEALFTEAGVEAVEVRTLERTARFPNIRTMVEAELRGWLPLLGVDLDEPQIAAILERAETQFSSLAGEEEQMVFPVSAHVASGARADEP